MSSALPFHGYPRLLPALLLGATLALGAVPAAQAQIEAMGSGMAWIFCNGDDRLDMVYLTPQGEARILVYNADSGVFDDHTSSAIPPNVADSQYPALGLACGDLNNDGFEDLFISRAGPNVLLLHNGDTEGTFRQVTRTAGIVPVPGEGDVLTASVAFLDYDHDGLLDIYAVNYEGKKNQLFRNTGVDGDGIPIFEDVAGTLGVDLSAAGSNWGLGVAVADYDNDGDIDLYVGNDYNGPNVGGFLNPGDNQLYRNEGDGTFADVSYTSGAADPGWAMGVAFADYNQDGLLDIFCANFWEDALLENQGDGTFLDVSEAVDLVTCRLRDQCAAEDWNHNGWGTALIDYDNDGDLDIHVANGFITNDQGQIDHEPDQLWENQGLGQDGRYHFVEVGAAAGIAQIGDARGATYGDFNRDGFVDFAIVNNEYVVGPGHAPVPARVLYINQGDGTFEERGASYGLRSEIDDLGGVPPRGDFTGNHWIEVNVLGNIATPVAIGSRVTVQAGGKTWIQDYGAGSYCSQNSPLLHFGLGTAGVIDQITVRYPDGTVVAEQNVPVDQIVTITPTAVPVRLLSFAAASAAEGARLSWTYADDGDVAGFRVDRRADGAVSVIAPFVAGRDGRGEFTDADAPAGRTVEYLLTALFRDGSREQVGTVSHRHEVPARLLQNFPNPFAAETLIPVENAGAAQVAIFDVGGRLLRTISVEDGLARWDGRDLSGRAVPAGAYFYRVADGQPVKMIRRP